MDGDKEKNGSGNCLCIKTRFEQASSLVWERIREGKHMSVETENDVVTKKDLRKMSPIIEVGDRETKGLEAGDNLEDKNDGLDDVSSDITTAATAGGTSECDVEETFLEWDYGFREISSTAIYSTSRRSPSKGPNEVPRAPFKVDRESQSEKDHKLPLLPTPKIPLSISTVILSSNHEDNFDGELYPSVVKDSTYYSDIRAVEVYNTPMKEDIIKDWFKKTEAMKLAGIDNDTKYLADWFHGLITRNESEIVLSLEPVGTFLIRISDRMFGYILSHKVASNVFAHFFIDSAANGYTIRYMDKSFKTLDCLVKYYQKIPITRDAKVTLNSTCSRLRPVSIEFAIEYNDLLATLYRLLDDLPVPV